MVREEIYILYKQVQQILANRPYQVDELVQDNELQVLHGAINELAQHAKECNEFFGLLAEGCLEVTPPNRDNLLASALKELQANLRHLTWQANQVAKGDYKQEVNFLGDFSKAFNEMTRQLQEREDKLKEKNAILSETKTLLCAVMDGMKDWMIVKDEETGEIIYTNESAKQLMSCKKDCTICGGPECLIVKQLKSYRKREERKVYEVVCCHQDRVMQIKSFYIEWEERGAYAHLITDITQKKLKEQRLETFAYEDELTGVYNRRYCMEILETMNAQEQSFIIGFIDIDKLKYVNDTFGHHTGDKYIKKVADALKNIIKPLDILARIGGDEFIIILYNDVVEDVEQRLQALCKEIEGYQEGYPMSISYGLKEIQNPRRLDTKEVLKIVDEAMYECKKAKK